MPKVKTKKSHENGGNTAAQKLPGVPIDPDSVVPYSEMSMDSFKLWSSVALKTFLSLRKKSVQGNFDELVARAYIAYEENIPVNASEEHDLRAALNEYKEKLCVGGVVLPDPFTIKDGWVSESNSMMMWPNVYLTDIVQYLNMNTPKELVHKLLNEYNKQGKAYRYFTGGWVGEALYHPVRVASSVCLFSTHVKPTMSLSERSYEVWISVAKRNDDDPGGKILSAYCTCPAGLYGTCNHVCGLLFRVEAAVKNGMNDVSCTSKPCQWNKPNFDFRPNEPVDLSTVEFQKHQYMRETLALTNRAKSVKILSTEFSPLTEKQEILVKDGKKIRADLANILKKHHTDSCFLKLYNMTPPAPNECREKMERVPLPPLQLAKDLMKLEGADASVEMLLTKMNITDEQCSALINATKEQASSAEWKEQRHGRCTASNSKRIYTRSNTLIKNPIADVKPLLKDLMGYKPIHPTRAMKHGMSLEPEAKRKFQAVMRQEERHIKFFQRDTGLHVLKEYPFIAASPDLLVHCDCHGDAVCEIKCPTVLDNELTPDNYSHLKYAPDKSCILSNNSEYYFQIQHIMGVTGCKYAYIFIYTTKTYHLELIAFDVQLWTDMVEKFKFMWLTYVAPEMLSGSLVPVVTTDNSALLNHNYYKSQRSCSLEGSSPAKISKVPAPSVLKHAKLPKLYLCTLCGDILVNDPSTPEEESVECCVCASWYHMSCLSTDVHTSFSGQWQCALCDNSH